MKETRGVFFTRIPSHLWHFWCHKVQRSLRVVPYILLTLTCNDLRKLVVILTCQFIHVRELKALLSSKFSHFPPSFCFHRRQVQITSQTLPILKRPKFSIPASHSILFPWKQQAILSSYSTCCRHSGSVKASVAVFSPGILGLNHPRKKGYSKLPLF